jgi:hypothetical protein
MTTDPISKLHTETIQSIKNKYATAVRYQTSLGKTIELTEQQCFDLWVEKPAKLKAFDKAIRAAIEAGEDPRKVKMYCLTPRSYAAGRTKVMSVETFCIANSKESKELNKLKKGDKHDPEAIAAITKARTGTHHSPETKKTISEKMTNMVRTETDRTNKSNAAKKRWAKYRAEKEAV